MAADMDPRVQALMAQLTGTEEKKTEEKKPVVLKPPKTIEDYFERAGLDDWPSHLTSENAFIEENDELLNGSRAEIAAILRQSAPVDFSFLNRLEDRLLHVEQTLLKYTSKTITDSPRQRSQDQHSGKVKTFITEASESDAVRARHSRKNKKSNPQDIAERIAEQRRNSVEYNTFPGFSEIELTELPHNIETPHILHRVTNAQAFNAGFRVFWKKIFLSAASIAITQDAFWWTFITLFEAHKDDKMQDRDRLYDRLADSYVALFTSIHPDMKDKFLNVYPDCLAQAIFAAYHEAFPESHHKFDESFKQQLVDTLYEWISGSKPPPGSFKVWNIGKLEPEHMKEAREDNKVTKALMSSTINSEKPQANASLDMEGFHKVMAKLGGSTVPPSRLSTIGPLPVFSRDVTKMSKHLTSSRELTQVSNGSNSGELTGTSLQIGESKLAEVLAFVPATSEEDIAVDVKLTANEKSKKKSALPVAKRSSPKESHTMGPGPDFGRVLFSLAGHCPLIAHYLNMRKLRDEERRGPRVKRTEIRKEPPPGQTYRDFIIETVREAKTNRAEYNRKCQETEEELSRIEQRKMHVFSMIAKLEKELGDVKHAQDIKDIMERAKDIKRQDREVPPHLIEDETQTKRVDSDISFSSDENA